MMAMVGPCGSNFLLGSALTNIGHSGPRRLERWGGCRAGETAVSGARPRWALALMADPTGQAGGTHIVKITSLIHCSMCVDFHFIDFGKVFSSFAC